MKHSILIMSFIAAMFSACSTDVNDEFTSTNDNVPQPEQVTLSFSPYSMENATRASAVSAFATHLDVWISDGTTTTDIHQSTSDATFGTVSLTLDKTKTYTLYAIAHNCTSAATLTGNIVSFPDNKVTQSFFYKTEFTPAETTSLSCVMNRIVGQFRFEIADAVDDDCTQMKFTVYQTGTTFNVSTEESGSPIDKVTHYTSFTKNQTDGSANFTVTILPDDQTDTSYFTIKVEAMKANNDVIQERTFTDVPIKASYKTTYHGTFFIDEAVTSTFTVNDWSSFDTVEY